MVLGVYSVDKKSLKMLKLTFASLIALLFLSFLSPQSYDLAIEDVSIYDPYSRTSSTTKTVLINGDRIAKIVGSEQTFKAQERIQGNGKLLTPGFIDSHVHINQMYAIGNGISPETIDQSDIELMQRMLAQQHLRYGTTTIIDMGHPEAWIPQTLAWQKNQVAHSPNIYINGSSTISDEDRVPAQHHHEVMNPEDAKSKVKRYADQGIKYMKLYSRLRAPEFAAITEEAKNHDIILNAHVDYAIVTIQEAMEMGVRNFEHFFTVLPCVIDYDQHWGQLKRKYGITSDGIDGFSAMMSFFFMYIDEIPEKKKEMFAFFDLMAAKGASISTTIHVLGAAAGNTNHFTSFNHFPIRKKPNLINYSGEDKDLLSKAHKIMMAYLKEAYDRGVKIRIGTDCRYGGRSMQSELKLLSEAGFSSEDILEIATVNGYEAMGLTKDYGKIVEGMKADLILFDKNPLEDARHFDGEKLVIKDGVPAAVKRSLAYEMLDAITFESLEAGLTFYEQRKEDENYELHDGEMKKVALDLLGSGLVSESEAVFHLVDESFDLETLRLKEDLLNTAGYGLLGQKKYDEAIRCFVLNTKWHPNSWNVWDSLGEGNMMAGFTEEAIKHYEKSIELNPDNKYGKEMLVKLRSR